MRYYFHICDGGLTAQDGEGMELPSFFAALEEGGRIAEELVADPDTASFRGGVVNIVASNGSVFMTLPISPPAPNRLN